ncbi:hypothetical protein THAOC_16897 [Thalassiosira oceanica]|uniref:Uncharacterized protein n=1 Tax=Thalassiosira oceanica TaxID=159749 RepID=K0S8I4_THAOC|nr:hypothetical protein THAOC_16897 [Thalassiosira oceanica]|eukprot:EJK62488.1 hypothetical protein THAOC_16897 [Thalassiosira oceanica]
MHGADFGRAPRQREIVEVRVDLSPQNMTDGDQMDTEPIEAVAASSAPLEDEEEDCSDLATLLDSCDDLASASEQDTCFGVYPQRTGE